MPKVIGIAGQVGAGKSLVLQTLNVLYGIPLFDCDKIAKESYFIPSVREEIIDRFGV
ncbi:dephospho-CoA kinase, partial [Porphyromonas sp. CAG:1061]